MAETRAAKPKSAPFFFFSTDQDSPISSKYQNPSAATSANTYSSILSPLYDSLTVEDEVRALAQVAALRELNNLLDQELTPVSVREESQVKVVVQLKSPLDSPFLKRRGKMGFSELAAPFHDH